MKIVVQAMCEKCAEPFTYIQRKINKKRRFCSHKCANSHIQTKDQNDIRRLKVLKYYAELSVKEKERLSQEATKANVKRYGKLKTIYTRCCKTCNNIFKTKKRKKARKESRLIFCRFCNYD